MCAKLLINAASGMFIVALKTHASSDTRKQKERSSSPSRSSRELLSHLCLCGGNTSDVLLPRPMIISLLNLHDIVCPLSSSIVRKLLNNYHFNLWRILFEKMSSSARSGEEGLVTTRNWL